MSFNSKYSGQQVENLLDQVANGNIGGEGGVKSGNEVYVGAEEPTEDTIVLWVDEDENNADSGSELVVDTEMSDTSTNVVQNKVIKKYVDGIIGDINTILDNINGEEI